MRLPLSSISPFDLFKNFEDNYIIHLPDQKAVNMSETSTIPFVRNLVESLNKVADRKENDYYYFKKYEEYRNSRKVEEPLGKNYSYHVSGGNGGRTKENERSFMNINVGNMNSNNDNHMSYYLRRNMNKNDNGRRKMNITTVTECNDSSNRMLSFHEKPSIKEENKKDVAKIYSRNKYDQNYFKELVENHPSNCICMDCKVFNAITTSKHTLAEVEKRVQTTQMFGDRMNEMEFEKPIQSDASFIEAKQAEKRQSNKLNGIKNEIHSLIDMGFKKLFFKKETCINEARKESRYEKVAFDEKNQIKNDGTKRSISTCAIPNILF